MADKTVLELSIEAASQKQVARAMNKSVGAKFWKDGYEEANKRLKKHMQLMDRLSGDAAEVTSRSFMDVFAKSAAKFGKDLQTAAEEGSTEFEDSMVRALRKIREIRASNDEEHADQVEKTIDAELKGLKELVSKRKAAGKGGKGAGNSGMPGAAGGGRGSGGSGGGKWGKRAKDWGGALEGAGGAVGGNIGGVLKGAGGMVGAAGPYLAVAAALMEVAKMAHQVQVYIKDMNKKALQYVSATDLMGTGTVSATDAVTDLRSEFANSVMVNQKWRMTVEEGLEAVNAFSQGGVSMGRMMRETGRTQMEVTRDMSDTALTYAATIGVSVGEIGKASSDMMLGLHYSLQETKEAFSVVNQQAIRAGISSSMFFGKVQSLNSQLDAMNSSLKVQAKLMTAASKSTFGLEAGAKELGTLLSKPTQQQAWTDIYNAGEQEAIAIVKQYQKYLTDKIKITTDPAERKKLEAILAESQAATAEGGLALSQFMQVYSDETTRLGLKMASLAKVFSTKGMDLWSMSAADFTKAIHGKDTAYLKEQIKQLGIFGSTEEEVAQGLDLVAKIAEDSGAATMKEALGSRMEAALAAEGQVSADELLAQEYRRNTTDIAVILGNIKDLLYNQIYGVLLDLYEIFVKKDQEKALIGLRKAQKDMVSTIEKTQGSIATETDPAKRKALIELQEKQQDSLKYIGGQLDYIGSLNEDQFSGEMLKEGGYSSYLAKTVGSQFAGGAPAGFGGISKEDSRAGGGSFARVDQKPQTSAQVQADKDAAVAAAQTSADTQASKSDAWQKALGVTGAFDLEMKVESIRKDPDWDPADWESFKKGAPTNTYEKYIQSYPDYYDKYFGLPPGTVSGLPQFADGGVVNRPTIALIGEEGPEAVVPLGQGGGMGVTINIYGGDLQAVRREVGNALRIYDKSQRV